MNRAQNSFVDEQLKQVQSIHDELRCCFADHKTMQIRPATTYDLSDKSRICLLDIRDAPDCEFDSIRQYVRNLKPYMLAAQYNDDNSNDDSIRALCEQQANQGGYFLLNLSKGTGFDLEHQFGFSHQFAWTHPIVCWNWRGSPSSLRLCKTSCGSCSGIRHRTIPANWIGARVGRTFFNKWSTSLTGNLAKVDRKNAERTNQVLQKKIVPDIPNRSSN